VDTTDRVVAKKKGSLVHFFVLREFLSCATVDVIGLEMSKQNVPPHFLSKYLWLYKLRPDLGLQQYE